MSDSNEVYFLLCVCARRARVYYFGGTSLDQKVVFLKGKLDPLFQANLGW